MHLKTTNNLIIEKGYFSEDSSLLLTGCEGVCSDLKKYQNFDPGFTCACNEFKSVFTEDDKFFYRLEHYKANDLLYTEVGIGHIKNNNLIRLHTYFGIDVDKDILNSPSLYSVPLYDSEYLHISNYVINNPLELMVDSNVITYSNMYGAASPLYVEENSLIGRSDEGIQSLPFSSFINKDNILSLLSSIKTTISLKATKLYCKTFNCSSLVVSLSNKTKKPPKGTVILDKADNKLKLFDGSNWNVLVTQKD